MHLHLSFINILRRETISKSPVFLLFFSTLFFVCVLSLQELHRPPGPRCPQSRGTRARAGRRAGPLRPRGLLRATPEERRRRGVGGGACPGLQPLPWNRRARSRLSGRADGPRLAFASPRVAYGSASVACFAGNPNGAALGSTAAGSSRRSSSRGARAGPFADGLPISCSTRCLW